MSEMDRRFWPFKPRTSIILAIVILVSLLLILAVLRVTIKWPSQDSETTILIGVLLFSLLPIFLSLIDVTIERGGVIEYGSMKIDFSQMRGMESPGFTVPVNVGVRGQPVTDSSTTEILDSLRQATESDVVVIDIEKGQAWWETRLLVLLAGAVRLKKPEKVVFVGTDGGVDKCFLGWGHSIDLMRCLLQVDPQYLRSFHFATAIARQFELIEPKNPADLENPVPLLPDWMLSGSVPQNQWFAFNYNTGLPNELFAEQLLASDLGSKVEMNAQQKGITLVRLEEMFRPVLHRESIDERLSAERQISAFFNSETPYIAVTRNGQYTTLVSRLTVLNAIVRTFVEKK
ncbi:MAG: hypothetical protein K8S18_10920 [Desulfobacula sp.]|nr:hypothetical protein [Desulfobacula sp.]